MSSEVETSRCESISKATSFDSLTCRSLSLRPTVRVAASPAAPFSTSLRSARNDSESLKQRGPAGLPAGPFVKLPELSGCHAAGCGAAGATTTAVCVTGRDRRRARQRRNCCNQKQIFHNSLLLRFREFSAERTRTKCALILRRAKRYAENQTRGGGVGGRSIRADAVASSTANVRLSKRGVGNPFGIGQERISVE